MILFPRSTDSTDGSKNSYQSQLVFKLSCTWLLVNLVVMSTGPFLFPGTTYRWVYIIGVVSGISLLSLLLNRYGYTRLASYVLPGLLYIHITISAITGGGTSLPGLVNFVPIILTAGFLLGGKRGGAFALLCILTTLALAYFETNGFLSIPTWHRTPLTRFVALLLPFSITAAVQYFATNHIQQTQKNVEKSEANLQAIFMTTDTIYLLTDEKFRLVSFNHAAINFGIKEFGRVPEVGEDIQQFVRPERKPEMDKLMQDVLQGNFVHYETSYLQENGTLNYYDVKLSPIEVGGGRHLGILLSLVDVTDMKNAQNEICALNESLEQKVEERTRELQQANRELEAFSYTVSHDLQAPLRVIQGYGNLLMRDQAAQLDKNGKEFITVITNQVDRMNRLIKDLLSFSQFGKAPLNIKEVSMNDVVKAATDEIMAGNVYSKTELQIDNLLTDTCDPSLMKQVWINFQCH